MSGLAHKTAHLATVGLLMAATVGLSACQTGTPVESGRAVARQSLQIDEAIAAFSDLCLADSLTKADIARVAEKYDFGIAEPADIKRSGQPQFVVSGIPDPGTGRYKSYGCAIGFQGAWSDEIVADVSRAIAARGFTAQTPFSRTTEKAVYPPVDQINHKAVYRRGGKPHAILLQSSLPGRTTTHRYVAHSMLLILAP
ncbi:hypothetical protein [Frigidibacter sp. SD6-1]|uniref:hypothetical protein n=1 Tax=Frigidibacter sp. SD6-1 TaxID=3032581 RepID=UPI0024DFE658|nr:hypothetical protein [Frigidibacter sp. SD6-1]